MSNQEMPLNHDALTELLEDRLLNKIVTVIDVASLSILELVEYGFTRMDISRAMAKGVIEFENLLQAEEACKVSTLQHILETDHYFALLSSKIRLAKLGLFMLEIVEADEKIAVIMPTDVSQPAEQNETLFHQNAPHM